MTSRNNSIFFNHYSGNYSFGLSYFIPCCVTWSPQLSWNMGSNRSGDPNIVPICKVRQTNYSFFPYSITPIISHSRLTYECYKLRYMQHMKGKISSPFLIRWFVVRVVLYWKSQRRKSKKTTKERKPVCV